MDMITKLSVEARAHGMTYGEYVATMDEQQAAKFRPLNKGEKICAMCGERYEPPKCKDEKPSKKKICPKCLEIKEQLEDQKPIREGGREYVRNCTRCGVEVITRQAPRNLPLYCPKCRAEAAKEAYIRKMKKRGKKYE